MTAQEFLENKGISIREINGINLPNLLEDYYLFKSSQKINVDRKFVNLTEKYEAEKTKTK